MHSIWEDFIDKFVWVVENNSIISVTDIDGLIKYVSPEFCKISEYKKEELLWQNHRIIRHPDMSAKVFKNMRQTIVSWKTRKWIVKNRKKSWDYYRVKTVIVPIKDKYWKINDFMSVRTDVTKLVDSINELNNYKKAIDTSSYFLKLDEKWLVKYVSKNFINVLWHNEQDILWKSFLTQIYFDDISTQTTQKLQNLLYELKWFSSFDNEENSNIEETLKSKKIWRWIIKHRTKYFDDIWTNTTIVPILDLDKKIKEYIIISNDVTDLEIAKQKLKFSFHKLKELDEKKTEFLNIASHELRTPMTSIKWYISMMLDWDLWEINEETKPYLSKILDSSNRLINLINDMLDVSKLESARLDFDASDFDLISLINDIIIELKPIYQAKNQEIIFIKSDDEILLESDKNKIKQVILNLLSNAIKFSPNNSKIQIICNSFDDYFKLDIIDEWMWISKENQKLVFEKFGQVKNSLTRDINGTGLWLPIVKSIIERMWWEIYLESEENKGSKFSFKLDKKINY